MKKQSIIVLMSVIFGLIMLSLGTRLVSTRGRMMALKNEMLEKAQSTVLVVRNDSNPDLRHIKTSLCKWTLPSTNDVYEIGLRLDEPWKYTDVADSGLLCQVDFEVTESILHSNTCVVCVTTKQSKPRRLLGKTSSASSSRFTLSKDFMNESLDGLAHSTAYKDRFNVFAVRGRQQPTDAGYLYLFVFPPDSGFTTEDTVALFKSPETFPYDEFDGVLIRARLNLSER